MRELLVETGLPRSPDRQELLVLVYPSGMTVSTQSLTFVTARLRAHRRNLGTRWRLLSSGRQALMVLAHLRKGETYRDLAVGFGVGVTTAYRYLREALEVLAGLAPTLQQAMQVCARKAYVILDGTVLRIDRVAMASGNDRPYYSGKAKAHGVNVQVIADPAGRLIWASPALPGARQRRRRRRRTRHPPRAGRGRGDRVRRQRLQRCRRHDPRAVPQIALRPGHRQVRFPPAVGRAEGRQPRPLRATRAG
jgi:Helix-turn-helix of DDE superfamily endonuclease/DDE superfamily endonuclease